MSELSKGELEELAALTFAVEAARIRVRWYEARPMGNRPGRSKKVRVANEERARTNLSVLRRMLQRQITLVGSHMPATTRRRRSRS